MVVMSEVVKMSKPEVVVPPKPEGLVGRGFFELNVEEQFLWRVRRSGDVLADWKYWVNPVFLLATFTGSSVGGLTTLAIHILNGSTHWEWLTLAGLGVVCWVGMQGVVSRLSHRSKQLLTAAESTIAADLGKWLFAQRIQVSSDELRRVAEHLVTRSYLDGPEFHAANGDLYRLFRSGKEFEAVLWDVELVESAVEKQRSLPFAKNMRVKQSRKSSVFDELLDMANSLAGSPLEAEDAFVVDRALKELYELSQGVSDSSVKSSVGPEVAEALKVLKAELDDVAERSASVDERKVRGVTDFIRSRGKQQLELQKDSLVL